MSNFESELAARLSRNEQLAEEHDAKRREMAQWEADREEAEREEQARLAEQRSQRHRELASHLERVAGQLKDSAPEQFVVRVGWTESREELMAKLSTRLLRPARSLFIELDRGDDEVLARWTSDVGSSIELWRLLEVEPGLLTELVLQVADQELWRDASRPPAFPGAPEL